MTWIVHLIQWVYANVLGNLVASIIWVTPTFVWHHRRLTKHHEMHVQAVMDRLDMHFREGPHADVPEEADPS